MGRVVRMGTQFLLVLVLVLGMAGCSWLGISPGNQPLPTVAPLPPPQLPAWIEEVSPTGQAEPLAQIRIRFKEAVIPVESLDSSDQQEKLKKFEILPPLPGRFRFLTPRMVGFQADQALPKATRVRITLKSGLADLKNHRLDQDLAWTFNTEPLQLSNLPTMNQENPESQAIDIKPTLKFTSNVELDVASIQEHLKLLPPGKDKGVRVKVDLEKQETKSEEQPPQEQFNPTTRNWNYTIVPQQTLEKATRYRLEFSPGVRPARGNLPSEMPIVSQVVTYSPLKFQKIEYYGKPDAGGTYGRFVKGSPQLIFNNGVVADSAVENITVSPAPKQGPKVVQADDGSNIISLNPWALDPATTYTITLGGKLKDQFGQTLDKPVTLKYETGDIAGDIWAPSNLNIFPAGQNLQLNITTVNLPDSQYKAAYRVLEPNDLIYTDSAYPKGNSTDLLPNPNSWESFKVSGKKNQSLDVTVPLQERLGGATGMVAYGIQARTNRYPENGKQVWREPTYYGMVQLTNLGVFAQWFPDSGMIRVNHLSDGSAVADAAVEIYESKLAAKVQLQSAPCATGKTDQTGTWLLNRQDLQQCMKSKPRFNKGPELLIIARENQDWAFARTEEYSGSYGYGLYSDWDDGKPKARGTIFSDRQLYKPGEKVQLTGVAYYFQQGTLKQDKNARYKVTASSPNGQTIDLGNRTTNEFGTFSLEFPLEKNQPLGYYFIQAKGDNEVEFNGDFRVAEFKPPNFKVDLALDKEFALMGDQLEAKAQSNYLFGSPVEAGKTEYYVTRTQAYFTPKGWEKFSFGRQWFWPEESPVLPSDVMQSRGTLDNSGKGSQIIKVGKDLPYPMNYRVDVQVRDVSNLSVSDFQTFTALPSDRLIGLQSSFVADAGKPFKVEWVVTDPTGKVLDGQRVRLELQQMKYSSVTRLVEGSQTPKNQVEYKTVQQTEVRSSKSPQTVELIPPESGSYRIRANFANTKDEITATDLQIWATGENAVSWGERDGDQLELKLDKESYKPGETATALIQSPYPEAELYFAVVRDKPLYQTITKVKGGAPQIQFQVTPEMLPNAAVEAVLVRAGVPLNQVEPSSVDKLVKIGFVPFKLNLDEKHLKVQVTPAQPQLQPGSQETLQLELKDAQGNPVKGQLTVMAVNEAVLQLSGYRPPDLVEIVYAEQPISTRFSDNRPNVVVQPATMAKPKGWGYGGGQSAGAASTRVRTDFQPLAYYNGSVLTDESGRASVTFPLPDDLTTWRVMAVAVDGNFDFGNGEATFITTKPLLSNPVVPQFARPGDRLEVGLSVTNTTGQSGNLSLNGAVNGAIQFEKTSGTLQTKAESGTRAYRFPVVASRPGESQVRFTTQLNGVADAFAVPLEVKSLDITEQVVESGTTTNQLKIPLNVDKKVVPDAGGLEISLASTLIPEITAPANQVFSEDQLPFLEPAASQLMIAANLQTLSQKYSQIGLKVDRSNPQSLTQHATLALENIQKLQLSDGGFAAWPRQEKSDPFVTAYTADALAQASKAFPGTVDTAILSRLTNYLKKVLADPGQYDFCKDQLCKNQLRLDALIALTQLGDKRNDFLADIYAQQSQFDPLMQTKLARYLSQFPEWQPEAQTLFNQLRESVYQTGRYARVNLPQDVSWISSPTAAQAQMLRLMIAQNSSADALARSLQSLLSLRRHGTWGSSYDNAQALTALVEYTQLQPSPPNFTANVKLAGKNLGSARFNGYRTPSVDFKVPTAELPRNRHDLVINKSGQGTLHYLVSYRYRLQGNQSGRFNGLRVVREIRHVNGEKVLHKSSLYAPDEPLKVDGGQVFDIGLEIISDHPVDHVVITDPLPAGFEAVDSSFQTSTAALQAKQDDFGFKTIYPDRIVAYSDRLEAGVYSLHYLVRSVTPGTFLWPGAQVQLKYAPEEFGRSADSTLMVSNRS